MASTILSLGRDGEQLLVDYVSHVLAGAKQHYPFIEKFAYVLLNASKKLCSYFESNRITVLTYQPLQNTPEWYGSSRRMLKWVVKLVPFGSNYDPRKAIKDQTVADFIAECSVLYK